MPVLEKSSRLVPVFIAAHHFSRLPGEHHSHFTQQQLSAPSEADVSWQALRSMPATANNVHEDLLPTFTHCWPHFCLLILLPTYLPDDALFQIYELCYQLSRSASLKSTIWCCHHCLAAKLHRHFLPTSPLVWPHFFQQTDISNKIFCLGL